MRVSETASQTDSSKRVAGLNGGSFFSGVAGTPFKAAVFLEELERVELEA